MYLHTVYVRTVYCTCTHILYIRTYKALYSNLCVASPFDAVVDSVLFSHEMTYGPHLKNTIYHCSVDLLWWLEPIALFSPCVYCIATEDNPIRGGGFD